jgi:hypothetical protein
MPRLKFEPTTQVFQRPTTVHASVIGTSNIRNSKVFLRKGTRISGNNTRSLSSFTCSPVIFTCQSDSCRHRLHARRPRWCKQSTGLPPAPYIPQDTSGGSWSHSSSNCGKRRDPSSWHSRNWQDSWGITDPLCCSPRSVLRCEESISSPQCPHNKAPGSYQNGQIRGGQQSDSSAQSPAEIHGTAIDGFTHV